MALVLVDQDGSVVYGVVGRPTSFVRVVMAQDMQPFLAIS